MKNQWMTAALLSTAFLVGCSDRGTDNAQNTGENSGSTAATGPTAGDPFTAEAPAAPPAPVSPNRDASAVRPNSQGARSTTGTTRSNRTPAAPSGSRIQAFPDVNSTPAAPRRPAFREVTLPAGTSLPLELTTALSSETATIEMPVTARLRQAVTVDGVAVLPAGALVEGEVIEVDRPGRVQGRARLGVRFTSITIGNTREPLRTNPVSFEGEASKATDATKIGAGAGIGAIIGGIVGGGDGAAKGAAIGGAAGTGAVLATRGKEVSLPTGTDVTATLASAVDFQIPNR